MKWTSRLCSISSDRGGEKKNARNFLRSDKVRWGLAVAMLVMPGEKKKHQRLRCCTSCTPFGFQMIQQKWQHVPSSKVLQKWICLKMGHTVVYSQIAIQQERKYGKLMSNHDQPTDSAWSWRVSRVNRSILSSGLRAQLGARDRTNAFAKALNGSITVGMAMGNPKYP